MLPATPCFSQTRKYLEHFSLVISLILWLSPEPCIAADVTEYTANALRTARSLLADRKYEESFDILDALLDRSPKLADGYVLRAQADLASGMNKQALEDCNCAADLEPALSACYSEREKASIRLWKTFEAKKVSSDTLVRLSIVKPKKGKVSKLVGSVVGGNESICVDTMVSDPSSPLALDVQNRPSSDELTKELRMLDRAIKDNPGNATAYYIRGQLLDLLDRHHEALTDFSTVVSLQSMNLPVRLLRAVEFDRLGDHKSATEDIKFVLSQMD